MPYGTIKVDTITFTDAGVDKSVAISGLVQNPTFTGNVTATGTISGLIVQAPTVTGTTANFASGVYTTQISGAIVKVPAGSAGAPSIQVGVGASVAPGLYGAGTDLLGISTGGAGRIFIDSTGQLGVGTSSPTARLDLGAPGNVNFFQASNGVNSTLRFTFASNLTTIGNAGGTAGLALETNGSERLRIDSAGNVGIGTSSPQEKLHIEGAGRQSLRINNTTPGSAVSPELTTIDFYGWSSQPKARIEAQDQAINFNGGWLALSTANTSNVLTRALTIDNSQRVGIGTSSPTTLLHVNQPGVTGGEYGVRVSQISATANALKLTIDSTNTLSGLMQESTVPLVFGTNNTERLRIDSSGRLLIGTNTSTTQSGVAGLLQVEATSGNEAAIKVKNNQNTSTAAYVALSKSRGTTVNSNTIVQDGDNIGSVIWFAADGIDTAGYCAEITAAIDGTPGIDNVPGRLVFSTAANGNATASERMRIDSSGRVGIGTSSPGNALHVIGSIQVGSTSDTIYSSNFGNYSSSSDLSLISGSANLLFKTGAANTERARIDTSGNLGIGTNTPTAKLESYFSSTNPSLSSNTGAGLSVYGTSTVRLNFGNYPASPYSSWVQSSDGLGNAWPIALNPLGGNVGIGTSSPLTKLDVRSGVITAGTLESTNGAEILRGYYSGSGALTVLGTEYSSGGPLLGSCVKPSTSAQGAFLSSTGVAGATRGAYVISGNEHKWYIGAAQTVAENSSVTMSEAMRIDSSGRVGIGTSSPIGKLDVTGSNVPLIVQSTVAASNYITHRHVTSGDIAYIGNGGGGALTAGTTSDYVIRANLGSLIFACNGDNERARIDSSGRLLVGTSSTRAVGYGDNAYFLVEGTGYQQAAGGFVNNEANANGPSINLVKTRGTSVGSFTAVTSGDILGVVNFAGANGSALNTGAQISAAVDGTVSGGGNNDMPGRLVFSTTADSAASPTERMRISQNGNILCRTNANNNNATLTVYSDSTTGFTDSIVDVVFAVSSPNDTTARFAAFRDTTIVRAEIRSNGGLANYSANNVNLSDRNAKKDIAPASGTWNSLKEWEIVNFRYKDQPEDADLNMGVIAQQVAESCPEVITVFQEAKEATEDQPAQEERLGVKDQQMMWMAIKALQEALERIETLEAKVSALEGN